MAMRYPIWLLAFALAACGEEAATVQNGMNAYQQSRIADAERMFAVVAADPAAPAGDKAAANRELARIAWLIDRREDTALDFVAAAEATGEGLCHAFLLRDRILREAGKPEPVLAGLADQLERCDDPEQQAEIRLAAADAALALARDGDQAGLARAAELIGQAGGDAAGTLSGSSLRLEIALLGGDAAAALQAWKDYFWLSDQDAPQGLTGGAQAASALFAAGLAPDAGPEARLALLDLLVRAGFARPAERFAARYRLAQATAAHPLWRKASAYFWERARLERAILASNRRVARGGGAADLASAVRAAEDALIAAAGLKGDRRLALRQAYGLFGTVGDTGGFASVHLGHVVQHERQRIEQYGHRADVGFLVLDNMLANGYQSWLWDGAAAAGGWTEDGPVIVQVRPEYVSGPMTMWRLATDAAARRKLLDEQARQEAAERTALAGGDVAYLPALAARLRLQFADQLLARVRAGAKPGVDLRRAFLDECWRASFQQSIFVHEGRHALDRKLITGFARFNDANLEYRAKLSELALADYPRLALYNIDASTIGGGSAHDKANGWIMAEYGEWIMANGAKVKGFDPDRPAMMQIDRLSDDQIRAIARSLDPLAP
jgi:hypothetical protein